MRSFINRVISQEVSKNTTNNDVYIVPTGKLLFLEFFMGGHERSTKEVRVELLIDGVTEISGYGYYFYYPIKKIINAGQEVKISLINKDTSDNLHLTGRWTGFLENV